jgi:hypothetical protein
MGFVLAQVRDHCISYQIPPSLDTWPEQERGLLSQLPYRMIISAWTILSDVRPETMGTVPMMMTS